MAAGLGYKEFATGDVLTAADANGYLASQVVMVFASAAARTSAIASPQEGMISYLKDTNATEYYSGSAWLAIGASSASGLTLISATSCSAVSSQAITAFSSTYTNYRIIYSGDGTVDQSLHMRLRSGSTDSSTDYYYYANRYFSSNTSNSAAVANGTDGFEVGQTFDATSGIIEVYQPFVVERTSVHAIGQNFSTTATRSISVWSSGVHDVSASYDGFNLRFLGGAFTGTIFVYGYQKA
jgi:hypothetical protein